MSIDQILQTAQGLTGNASRSFQVFGDDQFRSTLTVGQIIKGKVLRHYEGTKYQVEFSGQEKIVDSKIVLMEGSTIRGRVTEIADKVVLQRLADKEATIPLDNKEHHKQDTELTQLLRFLESVNIKLDTAQRNNFIKLIRSSSDRQLALMASMLLLKNGLNLSKDSIMLAEAVLREGNLRLPHDLIESGLRQLHGKSELESADNAVPMLAEYLKKVLTTEWQRNIRIVEDNKTTGNKELNDGGAKPDDDSLASDSFSSTSENAQDEFNSKTWLMNAQVDGSVAHRVATLPMWVGGKIVELDIAMFSQKERTSSSLPGTKYQKLVLSLETVNLGRVNITANIVNSHLKINIAGDNEDKVSVLAAHSNELHKRLIDSDWVVDEIKYQEQSDGSDSPVNVVAEHIVRQDSLSRLM